MFKNGKTICIDFDGVINNYKGYKGWGVFEEIVPGADKGIQSLKESGWTIIIFTTREETKLIADYCDDNGIPFDEINRNSRNHPFTNMGKPLADIYLDDRGITFEGNWEDILPKINSFKPWNEGIREV